jgi:uncharacterized protein
MRVSSASLATSVLIAVAASVVIVGVALSILSLVAGDTVEPAAAERQVDIEVPMPSAPTADGAGYRAVSRKAPTAGIDGGLVVQPFTADAFEALAEAAAGEPLPPAPDPALIQTTPAGRLPKVADDGRTARQVYARPFDRRDERARVVVIVAGIGLDRAGSEAAIKQLPPEVVMAIDAYAADPGTWVAAARAAGHEVLATVPLQDAGVPYVDAGPRALRADAAQAETVRLADAALVRLSGYVGVLLTGGSAFGGDYGRLRQVVEAFNGRGLLLVDGLSGGAEQLFLLAGSLGVPRVRIDVTSGDTADEQTVDRQLRSAMTLAQEQHFVVVAISATPTTLRRVQAWLSTLDTRRFVLAPVSAVTTGQ